VHLGCFVDDQKDWAHVPFLKEQLGGETCFVPLRRKRAMARSLSALLTKDRPLTCPYYYDPQLADWVERLRRDRPMTVFTYSSSMAQYVMDDRRGPRIMDFVDVDSEKWREYAARRRWPLSAVYRRESRTLLETERRIVREFDASLFVSDAEVELFRQLAPECANRVSAISVGVDWRHFSPSHSYPDPFDGAGHSVLSFTGMMDYWPNIDAVTWFAKSVFPTIRRSRPAATFWIVGANPTRQVRSLGEEPGVVVTGWVPDARPYLAHAAAVVAPLRVARGIQTKVLEAMAMGRPVVATPQAFEGIHAQPGRDLIVAQGPDDFVRAIEQVWLDGYGSLGNRARQTIERDYDWSRQLASLDDVLASIEEQTGSGSRFPAPSFVAV
jgi:sugar transferase (PEP-CTERM/EpsH1 system associated)